MSTTAVKTILIAGGSGLVGKRLTTLLESKKYKVLLLSRGKNSGSGNIIHWDPEKKIIDRHSVEQADVIINLAGEGIADKRWTPSRKRKIVNSRIFSTNLLSETLASTPNNVKLVINASAIGIYGNTGEMIMHEDGAVADDFLGKTCSRWENAAANFSTLGIRTVIFRIGVVLSDQGGMLTEIRKPMRFGIAPVFGSGNHYLSWIHIDDVCRMMLKAVTDEGLNGVYNAVAPGPLSNKNFMKLLTHIIGGDFWMVRIPKFVMKLILGEMSKVVTEGTRVSPDKIESAGFVFNYPKASNALRDLLDK